LTTARISAILARTKGQKMERVQVLLVGNGLGFRTTFDSAMRSCGYRYDSVSGGADAERVLQSAGIDIVVLCLEETPDSVAQFVTAARTRYRGMPLEVVLVVASHDGFALGGATGADDIVHAAASPGEVAARMRAAYTRLHVQRKIIEEREYYRLAVREEETIASRILSENEELKRAYRSLESITKTLEATNQRLQAIARFDSLSGLLNRVSLFSTMDVEIERSRRTNSPLAGFMTDIDHFKRINDDHGHPYGDAVIRTIGERLSQSLRKYDHAGRYGGEEFFIILPDTPMEGARLIAERFRNVLGSTPVNYGDDELHVTASIGVTGFKAGESRDSWVTRADQAMYLAKEQGRNKTCVIA
jgi:diguanylate cyclase (GGDEF)-like protein